MDALYIYSQRGAPGLAELLGEFAKVIFYDRPDLAEKMQQRLEELHWVQPKAEGEEK